MNPEASPPPVGVLDVLFVAVVAVVFAFLVCALFFGPTGGDE